MSRANSSWLRTSASDSDDLERQHSTAGQGGWWCSQKAAQCTLGQSSAVRSAQPIVVHTTGEYLRAEPRPPPPAAATHRHMGQARWRSRAGPCGASPALRTSNTRARQNLQKVWPQGVCTGSCRSSKHSGQVSSSGTAAGAPAGAPAGGDAPASAAGREVVPFAAGRASAGRACGLLCAPAGPAASAAGCGVLAAAGESPPSAPGGLGPSPGCCGVMLVAAGHGSGALRLPMTADGAGPEQAVRADDKGKARDSTVEPTAPMHASGAKAEPSRRSAG